MPLLETHGLDAFYGDFQALFGVDLARRRRARCVAIIGANGAGKSTLPALDRGRDPQRAATRCRFDGEPIGGAARRPQVMKRGIAMVPEGRRLFPSLTVEENLLIGGQRAHGAGPLDARRASTTCSRSCASGAAARRPSLSGGQQQMVAIGRALMSNPELLLCDEISLGLAPVVIRDIYAALPRIAASGAAIVVVEQDIAQALASPTASTACRKAA